VGLHCFRWLCASCGAADEKLVLIHDVQSYIYTVASPVAVALAFWLSPWLLASVMIHPAQSPVASLASAGALWYRWTGSEGCSVGNRGKLAKALHSFVGVLLCTKSLFTLAERSAVGMREGLVCFHRRALFWSH
jgi:hypothetical protein